MAQREWNDIPLELPEDEDQRKTLMRLVDAVGQRAFISWFQGYLFFDGEQWVLTGSKTRHEEIADRHLHILQGIVGKKNLRLNVEGKRL